MWSVDFNDLAFFSQMKTFVFCILIAGCIGFIASSGRKSKKYRWSNGIVPYVLDNSLTDQQKGIIRVAVKEINQEMGGCIEIRY